MARGVATLTFASFRTLSHPLWLTFLLVAITAAYISSTAHVKALPRPRTTEEINVAISPIVQILLSCGDAYLASNLATFRATAVAVQSLNPADYPVLAKIQDDASRLNPAQEDNYYIAQGILPWIGEQNHAIGILDRATQARPEDFMPPYFLGFNYMYFEGKYEEAGHYYRLAADRISGKNKDILLNNAAKFMEKGKDPATAIQFIQGLIKSTRNQGLQQFLQVRILRLQRLIILREAAKKYQQIYEQPPKELNELVESGILHALPADPLGVGYRLDEQGVPQIMFQIRRFN